MIAVSMTEAETRRKLIDTSLHLAGWNVRDNSQVIQELDIHLADAGMPAPENPTNPHAGHQFADYALLLHGNPAQPLQCLWNQVSRIHEQARRSL